MQEVQFCGARCAQLTLGDYRLLVTLDFGPRIISASLGDGPNLMKVYEDELASADPSTFNLYGGHRLWTSPEIPGFTDEPDNSPVEVDGSTFSAIGVSSGLRKSITISLTGDSLVLDHEIRNDSDKEVEIAPWALTVLKQGAICVIPQEPFAAHSDSLLPVRPLVLWSYTKMDDPRLRWGAKTATLTQEVNLGPIKFGAQIRSGIASAWVDGFALVKKFKSGDPAEYADFGCNFETFTRQDMLELETLGKLTNLEPGQSAVHRETWTISRQDAPPQDDDACSEWLKSLS